MDPINLSYDAFYVAMKSWGKYELLSAPSEADLIFEIHFTGNLTSYPELRLSIVDPKLMYCFGH